MRARTEDLLTIRDGEPIDAALGEQLAANPENAREIERLAGLAEDLRRLPMLDPPAGVWERIEARTAPRRRQWMPSPAHWAAGAAVAAGIVLLLLAPWPSTELVETAGTTRDEPSAALALEAPQPPADSYADYTQLVAESVRLELLLSELERSPRLMNAGTARTIADLEDHIVLVDEQLAYAEARGADPLYRQALWRERVDVMSALLHVRYAQAQLPTY